jgi:hypothetical protein
MPGVDDAIYHLIADGIPEVDERVIIIFSAPKERKVDRDDEDGDVVLVDDKNPLCTTQDALIRVFARIVEEGNGSDDEDEDVVKQVTARLLVLSNQNWLSQRPFLSLARQMFSSGNMFPQGTTPIVDIAPHMPTIGGYRSAAGAT